MATKHSLITEEALEKLRQDIGKLIVRESPPMFRWINEDSIRRFAHAVGDDNPLWTDPEYAAKTRWGGLIAPPCILYSTDNVVSGAVHGLPGVHAMFAGTDWRWYQPLRDGTRVSTKVWLKDLVEHKTRFAGRAIQQIYHVQFFDQHGTLLAEADSWCFRTERDTARSSGTKYSGVDKDGPRYSAADLERIREAYRNEQRRGSEPRYWEDVVVGEEIPTIVKGPYTITTAVGWMQAWGSYAVHVHKVAFDYYERHPALAILNANGVPEPPVRVHWDNDFAREVGVPRAYDFGPERISWMGHLMTNWMGDDGFLRRLNCQIRHHNLVGDTTWCHGRVTGKRIVDDDAVVDCEIWAVNQDGALSVKGTAEVVLPRRNAT